MKFCFYKLLLFISLSLEMGAQEISLSLLITGSDAHQGLPLASIQINDEWITTNNTGQAQMVLRKPGNYTINVGYVSFHDTSFSVSLLRDTLLTVSLKPRKLTLTEVKIWDSELSAAAQLLQREVLSTSVTSKDVTEMPLIGGEPDILKPLQSTPGVQGGLPGSADLYIRGSDQYQNGVMLDGFPIYNTSHIYGYISAIPPGATEKLSLHKEAYPIQYGNGAAGYINAVIKRASLQKTQGEAGFGIGSVYGHITVPVKKGTSALLAGGRFSSTGLVFNTADALGMPIADFTPGFNDMILKYHHRLSDTRQLEVLGYFSSDFLQVNNFLANGKLNVHNGLVGFTYRHQPLNGWYNTHKLFASNYRFFQDYTFKNSAGESVNKDTFRYKYRIVNLGWEALWNKNLTPDFKFTFGGEINIHTYFSPEIKVSNANGFSSYNNQNSQGELVYNPVGFLSFSWKITNAFRLNTGGRLSLVSYPGKTELLALPRVNLTYTCSKSTALFLALDYSSQTFHRYRSANFGSAIDLPVMPSANLPLQINNQLAAGAIFSRGSFDVQIQAFYRKLRQASERNYNAPSTAYNLEGEILPPGTPGSDLTSVNGFAYGLETGLKYAWSIFKFKMSYTWSRSIRNSPLINEGRAYNFEFNHEHSVRSDFIVRFKRNSLDKVVEIGSSWTYGSGYYTQFPLSFINAPSIPGSNGGIIGYIDQRNNAQLPPFHHLDLVINFIAQKKYGSRTFSISFFNVYLNPLYTSYDYDTNGNLIGANPFVFIPSINWSFKFK